MVELRDFGLALQGFGAGVAGQGPAFARQLAEASDAPRRRDIQERQISVQESQLGIREQELGLKQSEARQKALLTDSRAVLNNLRDGNISRAQQVLSNRLQAGGQIPGANMQDTKRIFDLVSSGDPEQLKLAQNELQVLDNEAVSRGALPKNPFGGTGGKEVEKIIDAGRGVSEIFFKDGTKEIVELSDSDKAILARARDEQLGIEAKQAGRVEKAKQRAKQEITIDGVTMQKVEILAGGDAVGVTKDGKLVLIEPSPEQRKKIQAAERRGVELQTQRAAGRAGGAVTGKGQAGRVEKTIDKGLTMARALPLLRRSLTVLGKILAAGKGTGGLEGAKFRARELAGVQGADQAELATNFGLAAVANLRPLLGSAFGEREGERIVRLFGRMSASTKANDRLLGQAIAIAEGSAKRALKAAIDSGDTVSARALEDFLDGANDLNEAGFRSIFNPSQQGTAPGAPQAAPAPPAAPEQPRVPGRALQSNALGREIILEEFRKSLAEENAKRQREGKAPLTEEQGKQMLGIQ